MQNRIKFQTFLEELIGSSNVYFQPPENLKMKYPAIVYSLQDITNIHADNSVYKQDIVYILTVIDHDPDSVIAHKISTLPNCSYDRSYVADNFNHTVFTIYYEG